jgi:hypothetical protein
LVMERLNTRLLLPSTVPNAVDFAAGSLKTSEPSKLTGVGCLLVDSVYPRAPLPRWAATLKFVIPTGAYPDFLLRGTPQQPRVRLSVRKAA